MSKSKYISKNSGFTLVELLVGLLLSVFIAGIALTYFASSSRTFRTHTNESIVQENARFALELINRSVRHAGVNPSASFANEMDVIFSGTICSDSESGLADSAAGSTACTKDGADNTTDNNSDRFAVDYMADATRETTNQTILGCNSHEIIITAGQEQRFASVFWTADIDGDGVRSLYCQAMSLESNSAEGAAIPLVEGVDRLQVQYGVDSNDDGIVERYQSFTNLGAANSDQVRTVRIALLMNSGLFTTGAALQGSSEDRVAREYVLLDGAEDEFDDAILRQVYSTTVMVHNVPRPTP